ncbi:MAG: glycosyltransferase [Kofleriaceae bacterium]|nr:glycosyltransferase [Kofleriaceae bacterium]
MIVWALWLATAAAGGAALAAAWLRLRALGRARPERSAARRLAAGLARRRRPATRAHNRPRLLASVARFQPAPAEVIVVDDHSRDSTGDLAQPPAPLVVVRRRCPRAGSGVGRAAGAAAATGDLLLFTDADTVHGPASLGRAVARLEAERADLVSVVPHPPRRGLVERLPGAFHLLLLLACRAGAIARRIGQAALQHRPVPPVPPRRLPRAPAATRRCAMSSPRISRWPSAWSTAAAASRWWPRPARSRCVPTPEGLAAFLRGWRRSFRDRMRAADSAAAWRWWRRSAGCSACRCRWPRRSRSAPGRRARRGRPPPASPPLR